jgi:hypothetical protein
VSLGPRREVPLTDDDQARINAFEKLADDDFLNPPPDASGSLDSVYARLMASAKAEAVKRRAVEKLAGIMSSTATDV